MPALLEHQQLRALFQTGSAKIQSPTTRFVGEGSTAQTRCNVGDGTSSLGVAEGTLR
jgi:hypothetical protein